MSWTYIQEERATYRTVTNPVYYIVIPLPDPSHFCTPGWWMISRTTRKRTIKSWSGSRRRQRRNPKLMPFAREKKSIRESRRILKKTWVMFNCSSSFQIFISYFKTWLIWLQNNRFFHFLESSMTKKNRKLFLENKIPAGHFQS